MPHRGSTAMSTPKIRCRRLATSPPSVMRFSTRPPTAKTDVSSTLFFVLRSMTTSKKMPLERESRGGTYPVSKVSCSGTAAAFTIVSSARNSAIAVSTATLNSSYFLCLRDGKNCPRSFSSMVLASPLQLSKGASCSSWCPENFDARIGDEDTCCLSKGRRLPISTWPFDTLRKTSYSACNSCNSNRECTLRRSTRSKEACPIRMKYALLSTAGCTA
mmetsp:Transcript_1331/g.3654  ORF Transcript_1331/g.3654 Transcript_1331/m.3654 type:complete len:217 (-) Transcript_1331:160-810(-)